MASRRAGKIKMPVGGEADLDLFKESDLLESPHKSPLQRALVQETEVVGDLGERAEWPAVFGQRSDPE